MSPSVDWRQAMLNEAEASGDNAWALDTRREAAGMRHWGRELRRTAAIGVALGVASAAVLELAPLCSRESSWLLTALLCAGLYIALGLMSRWVAGATFGAPNVLLILLLILWTSESLAHWPVQGWWGALMVAAPLAAAYGLGQWWGGHWQPFGAWRPFDPADFADTRGRGLGE